ncbi:DUF871 domain-containing protein [Kroppenstedtia pulmonis]|uniref:DUF871 domain-containing protein n=1 Tax=Kroppenstedtia pulmonis TaxID=1380685 RepID=A0A7D3XPA2_9BACL|nr:DUF871 domain-containing protein [Kroppenstedtia pulmonis]QKG85469.1 DUF871 domain-containing protein [Kroppenstedtia pulmonis]
MKQLGISIYPERSTPEQDRAYIETAHQYGFKRIFTCFLSAESDKENLISGFQETVQLAGELGMEVLVDIAPRLLKQLDISYDDLSFFHELGVYGIRLDLGFTGHEEAMMTYNPYGLKIEINMSNDTRYVDNILSFKPNRDQLIGCHNFYPHRYTGLSYDHFIRCSRRFKEYGLRTAAFINSPSATFGPWPVTEGLCTLEIHRNLPLIVQAKHLFATGLVDDVIIANAYASKEELKALGRLNLDRLTFQVELEKETTDLERKIVLEEPHFNRGDISDYVIRSTQSRVKYKEEEFPPHDTRGIRRGDLLIDNHLYGQYKGELQVALKDMENSGKTNVVGRIVEEEQFLLDYMEPWDKFQFQLKE